MITSEMAEGLALVALVRAMRQYPGFGAELITCSNGRAFAEITKTEPVRHAYARVIVYRRHFLSPWGMTPTVDLDELVAAVICG
ncbi:hypothetical protein ACFVH6_33155 [Spirillospora sp. NPDC127200]